MRIFFSCLLCLAAGTGWCQAVADDQARLFPSVTLQNPFNPGQWGVAVVSGVIQHRTRIAPEPDGNAEVYLGLGNPATAIGGGLTINIYGLTNSIGERNNLGQGAASLHVNRFLFGDRLLLDAGVENLVLWGVTDPSTDYITYRRGLYVSANYTARFASRQVNQPFSYLSITAGAGNGIYGADGHVKSRSNALSPFVSVAAPVVGGVHLLGEWNGYDLGAGIAAIPSQKFPVQLRAELTDFVFGPVRFVASVSLPVVFSKKGKPSANRPVGLKAIRPARTI